MTYDWNAQEGFKRRVGVADGRPQAIMLMERRSVRELCPISKKLVRNFLEGGELKSDNSALSTNGMTLRDEKGSTICYITEVEE